MMVKEIGDTIQVLKYIKSLKGDNLNYIKHTNSKDIELICNCCHNLLLGNFPLTEKEKANIKEIINPNIEKIKILARKNGSVKKKRKVLSEKQIGSGIFTLLATTLLPILISSIAGK